MSSKEEIIKQTEEEISAKFKQISELLSKNDTEKLHRELDNRVILLNESFLKEVKNISLITVTAAPFSLTLLLSGLNIEKAFLVAAFVLMMFNALFLNIGVWYLNSQFRRSTASQKLEAISIDVEKSKVLDEKKENTDRFNALYELMQSESRLMRKKMLEPYKQERVLIFLRDSGLIILSVAIVFLILSVASAIFPYI